MLVRISESCSSCESGDQGKIVDAVPNNPSDPNCDFVYFGQFGSQYFLYRHEIEILNVLVAKPAHEYLG